MQKSILVCLLATTLFTYSCQDEGSHAHDANGNHTSQEGTHQHEDGSVHQNHEGEVKQEQFNVTDDTTKVGQASDHPHPHDETHPRGHK